MRSIVATALGIVTMLLLAPAGARAQAASPIEKFSYDVRAEWLQAGASPVARGAASSAAFLVGRAITSGRLEGWRADAGWLRASRHETNAKGVTASLTRTLSLGRLSLDAGAGVLAGRAEAALDSGGYHWRDANGQTGYEPRPRAVQGATVGAGLAFGAGYRVGPGVTITGTVRPWIFSGSVMRSDRAQVLAGFGVSFRPDVAATAVRLFNERHIIHANAQEGGR